MSSLINQRPSYFLLSSSLDPSGDRYKDDNDSADDTDGGKMDGEEVRINCSMGKSRFSAGERL